MIIRKPYAFLIKYFREIHIGLFILMTYLAFKTSGVYMFFRDYIKNGTYTYFSNMTFRYVNILMVIISILLVGVLLLIYFLMKRKEKKVLYYLLATIYYGVSFVLFIYFISIFSRLEFTTFSNQSLVIYRDVSMILHYLNYIFLAFAFARGFGFNIKKFNFEKDLKELDIKAEDREEIELKAAIDPEQVGDFLRKRKRNLSYYIRENSYILTVILIVVSLSVISVVSINKFVVNKVYRMGNTINIDNVLYTVNNAYVINTDIFGNELKKDAYYVIVDVTLNNKNTKNYTLNISDTRIKIGDKYYYPKLNPGSKFNEFGTVYKKQSLKTNSLENYLIVYEIEEKSNNILLEIYSGRKEGSGEVKFYYKNVRLNPYDFKNISLGEYKVNDEISLSKTYFKTGKLTISNLEIASSEKYTYNKCISEDNCSDYEKEIAPSGNKNILKITYSLDIDKNIFQYLKVNGKSVSNITPSDYPDNVVLIEIPNDYTLDNLTLEFNIRNATFKIK